MKPKIPTPKPKMVVLDDYEALASMLECSLQADGWEVTSFTDPVDAVMFMLNEPVDVLLTDFSMPMLNGIEVAAILRRSGWMGSIFFMTALPGDIDRKVAKHLRIREIVSKPFNVVALCRMLAEAKPSLQPESCAEGDRTPKQSRPLIDWRFVQDKAPLLGYGCSLAG